MLISALVDGAALLWICDYRYSPLSRSDMRTTPHPQSRSPLVRFLLKTKRHCFVTVALNAVIFGSPTACAAYPEKPVRIIVPTIAGAGLDTLTRLLAQKLSETSGKAFVVDNRADRKSTRLNSSH